MHQIIYAQEIKGEVSIDFSNVDDCEEKEITFAFTFQSQTQNDFLANVAPLWESIQSKLTCAVPTSHEYSINIYNENIGSSRQEQKTQTETESDRCRIGLIKNANDFATYFEDRVTSAGNMKIATRVPLIIQVELFLSCKDIQNKNRTK